MNSQTDTLNPDYDFDREMFKLNKLSILEQIIVINDLIYFHKKDKQLNNDDKCFTIADNNYLIKLYTLELKKRKT